VNDKLIDVRIPLAASDNVRVEVGRDGEVYLVTQSVTLHLAQARCEELTSTLARAMLRLRKLEAARARPALRMVPAANGARESTRDE
jgi:hypothetical protein